MDALLTVSNLSIEFGKRPNTQAVTDLVDFSVYPGEILSLVGESGCGKSITALSILGLLPRQARIRSGHIFFDGKDLTTLEPKALDLIRGKDISMIFQDIMYSLNPVFPIGMQLCEGMRIHLGMDKASATARGIDLLARTGLENPEDVMRKFPHQLSGGQRQRVMIAMALACRPKLLIADEPTTALDVTIQAQIINLLSDLRQETGMAILLITHDIGLISELADRVVIMYAGQCVETGSTQEVLRSPAHEYTRSLLSAIPDIYGPISHLYSIPGTVPDRYDRLTGCRFAARCSSVSNCPFHHRPEMVEISPGHLTSCVHYSHPKVFSNSESCTDSSRTARFGKEQVQ